MTGVIDRLSKIKLIRRKPDPEDRRVSRICLTKGGRELSAEVDATGRALLSSVVRDLGRAKVETFIDALNEFLQAAKAAGEVKITPESQKDQGGGR
jgi:DNA-binding MarR family transcriptional regulator